MSEQQSSTGPDPKAVDFLARLGAAMVAANYPVTTIRRTLTLSSDWYGLSNQVLLLPNFIQFGGSDHLAGTTVRVVRSEDDLRFDQAFPLAALVDALLAWCRDHLGGRRLDYQGGGFGRGATCCRIHAARPARLWNSDRGPDPGCNRD
ncbi:hypothetical protein [Mycobacterium simiae]|uniref:hypothetical protein n=1 Tax=Mycobacterium simiae TaxID=1784 RepID=UPI0027B9B7DC|nr:hypothetical protein [Mycobacterium simiae]